VIETKGKPMVSNFPAKEERIFYGRSPLRRRGPGGKDKDVELLPRGESAQAQIPTDPEAGLAIEEIDKK
jgi:hypothetical protein